MTENNAGAWVLVVVLLLPYLVGAIIAFGSVAIASVVDYLRRKIEQHSLY